MSHTLDTSLGVALSTANPRTANYTCGSGTTVLIVAITVVGATARTGGAPTFNSIALTQCSGSPQKYTTSPETTTELWYLLSPPTVTQYTLSIPNTNTVNLYTRIASFKAASGASSLDGGSGSNGNTQNPSFNLTPTKAGDVLFAILGHGNTAPPTAYTHTSLLPVDHGQYSSAAQYAVPSSTSQVTMTFTIAADDWGMCWVAFKEVSPIASTVTNTSTHTAFLSAKGPLASVVNNTTTISATLYSRGILAATINNATTNSAALTQSSKINAIITSGIQPVISKSSIYGSLYNWYAAVYNTAGASIAPTGWHVPTQTEISDLIAAIGTYENGYKLKETGFTYWDSPNTGATHEILFYGRGTGYRVGANGSFLYFKTQLFFQSTTLNGGKTQGGVLSNTSSWLTGGMDASGINSGYSIRLLKNDSIDPGTMTDYDGNVYPTVKIGSQVWMAANLVVEHFNDGTVIPNVTNNTEWSNLTTPGICYYSNTASNSYSNIYTTPDTGTLTPKNFNSTSSSIFTATSVAGALTEKLITELVAVLNTSSSLTASIYSRGLLTATINTLSTNSATLSQNSKIRATISSGVIYQQVKTVEYGMLYNWPAITHADKISSSDSWLVPTETHYNTLSTFLGGAGVAGGKLKEAGTVRWMSPNTGANNSSGFNNRPGGYCSATGISGNIRYTSYFALNTLYDANNFKNAANSHVSDDNLTIYNLKNCGVAVRLVNPATSLSNGQIGTYTGNDGMVYPTICIGTQEWVSCNLIETRYRNNNSIPLIATQSDWNNLTADGMCVYNYNTNAYLLLTIWLSTLTPHNFGLTTASASCTSSVTGALTERSGTIYSEISTTSSLTAELTEKPGKTSSVSNTVSDITAALSIRTTSISSTINTSTSVSAGLLIKVTYITSTINPFTLVSGFLTEKPGKILVSVYSYSSSAGILQIQTTGILSTINPFTSTSSTLSEKPGKLKTNVFTFSSVTAGINGKADIVSAINPATNILAFLWDQPFLPTITFI